MRVLEYYPVSSLANSLQKNLENSFFNSFPLRSSRRRDWIPAMDVREENDRIVITADLPGINGDDIEIFVENDCLTIKGERQLERKFEDENTTRFERVEGTFERRFRLPETADLEQVSAASNNGVLEVVIKKQDTVPMKRIEVKTETKSVE